MQALLDYILQNDQDAVLWQSATWMNDAGNDIALQADVIDRIAQVIILFKNETTRLNYIDAVAKKFSNISKKKLQVAISAATERAIAAQEAAEIKKEAERQRKAAIRRTLQEYVTGRETDAVLWQVEFWLDKVNDDVALRAAAIDKIAKLLLFFKNESTRFSYLDAISQRFGITKKTLQGALNNAIEARAQLEEDEPDELDKMPAWMDKEEFLSKGFCTLTDKRHNRFGYYTWSQNGKVQLSNFLIHPVFHVEGTGDESRHIFEIENQKKRVLVDMPSKALVNLETLQNGLVTKGGFIFFGSKNNLLNVATVLLDQFPSCIGLKQMGWQPEGFFAYVNKVYKPGIGELEINKWGIVEIGQQNYLIPASSEIHQDVREGNDQYEEDKSLKYLPSKISFNEWATLMYQVYGNKGLVGTAFVFISIFCDIVFSIDGNCPFLYGYGERQSGKSKWAESVQAIFFTKREPFPMSSGTDAAFFSYVSLFRNCPSILNEFDDKVVRDPWFQSTKGFFEKQGRRKMDAKSNYKRGEVQKSDGTIIILGQFLSTKDDNSVVTRSVMEAFFEREFTEEEDLLYKKLKEFEREGITSLLTELMQHRAEVKDQYKTAFYETLSVWKRANSDMMNQRIFSNWCHLSTMWQLMSRFFKLPASIVAFDQYCYEQAVKWSKFVRDTDILSDFWNTVLYMLDQGLVIDGWDFRIVTVEKIRLRESNGNEPMMEFGSPKKLLLVRMNNVHKLYEKSYQERHRKEAMTQDNLMHYLKSRNYYIGATKQSTFKKYEYVSVETPGSGMNARPTVHSQQQPVSINTSAIVFDYELLGCDLERFNPHTDGSEVFT